MDETAFRRVEAIHPHWTGALLLSVVNNSAVHESLGSLGTYELCDSQLMIFWEAYGPDIFFEKSGIYTHVTLLNEVPKIDLLSVVTIAGVAFKITRISVPVLDHEVSLRAQTSDFLAFGQVFVSQEYESSDLPKQAEVIVDLGANVGFASVWFAHRYPQARLLSVEPEAGNYDALVRNTAALADRVQTVHAAVWTHDGVVNLHTESSDGAYLGAWGFQVSDHPGRTLTQCLTLQTLLDQYELPIVDILKIDIEGAELDIFPHIEQKVLQRVKLLIVETHDRFRPGSDVTVRKALAVAFEELPPRGENLFFRRRFPDS